MKKLLIFILTSIIILTIATYKVEAASKRDLPYEVEEVKINYITNNLEIKGWAFISEVQNYRNDKTHQYKLTLESEDHSLEIIGKNTNISHTETMAYVGSRSCGNNEVNKPAYECNFTYNNIGFIFEIPLDWLKMDKTYQAKLEVWAKVADVKKSVLLYFPLKENLFLKSGQKQLTISSKISDLALNILFNHIPVRDTPNKSGKIVQGVIPCSNPNNLYYKNGVTFHKVFDKESFNHLTYYKLGGKEDQCINGYALMGEGSDVYPIWIASNYVEYVGSPMTISTTLFNHPPVISVKNNPTIYVNDKINFMEGVSAYDFEDKDLTSKIIIEANTFKNTPGYYSVIYSVTDKDKTTSKAVKYITVLAKNFPPVINARDIEVKQYSAYNPYANVNAIDQDGRNITNKLKTTTTVDTSVAKAQLQCYKVTDDYNLSTNKCIVVNVLKLESVFRFIDKHNLFYLEEIPLLWTHKLDRLEKEVSNNIAYIKRTISL